MYQVSSLQYVFHLCCSFFKEIFPIIVLRTLIIWIWAKIPWRLCLFFFFKRNYIYESSWYTQMNRLLHANSLTRLPQLASLSSSNSLGITAYNNKLRSLRAELLTPLIQYYTNEGYRTRALFVILWTFALRFCVFTFYLVVSLSPFFQDS